MKALEDRFWVQDSEVDEPNHPEGWFGVVDDDTGGIVAFFAEQDAAIAYRHQLIEQNR